MSTAEILAELPRLSAQDRAEILARLCLLEEAAGPTDREMTLLIEAQTQYEANPAEGSPWSDVERRLRRHS